MIRTFAQISPNKDGADLLAHVNQHLDILDLIGEIEVSGPIVSFTTDTASEGWDVFWLLVDGGRWVNHTVSVRQVKEDVLTY